MSEPGAIESEFGKMRAWWERWGRVISGVGSVLVIASLLTRVLWNQIDSLKGALDERMKVVVAMEKEVSTLQERSKQQRVQLREIEARMWGRQEAESRAAARKRERRTHRTKKRAATAMAKHGAK